MLLDAPSFELQLTAEVALSIVQKEVQRRGWKKFEIQDIRLVYTPFYVFSFDVAAENAQPSGRAAINANTGELDEFVPVILDKPLKKVKATDEKSKSPEVEGTNISRKELESIAPAKVAAVVGLKRENVTASAIAKYYVPYFRIWVTAPAETGDTYRINVDALLGAPMGVETIPAKTKGWEDETEATLDRMKTPKGFLELGGETISSLGAVASGKGGGIGGFLSSKSGRWLLMGVAIIAIVLYLLFRTTNASASCAPDSGQLGERQYFDSFGEQYLAPKRTRGGAFYVTGTCSIVNRESAEITSCLRVTLKTNGELTPSHSTTLCAARVPPGGVPTEKPFNLTWSGSSQDRYSLQVDKIV